MNITPELITSILTQAEGAITCKNLRTEGDDSVIIIRFEDDTDTTISIYYTSVIDVVGIGIINSEGYYRNYTRIYQASGLDPETFCKYLIHVCHCLEIKNDIEEG